MRPFPIFFLGGLVLVNIIAIFNFDPLYIGSLFAFIYIVVTPGLLLLPFLLKRRVTPVLGIVFSVALSVLLLMLVGLGLNSILPLFGLSQPLSTAPLTLAFDVLIYLLLLGNSIFKKDVPFEFHGFNKLNWFLVSLSVFIPILACIGTIILNNGGSDSLSLASLIAAGVLVLLIILNREKLSPSTPPIALFMLALTFLLMNSMRGWFVTGHDILLEYNVFNLTNDAHFWNIAAYRDPYNACLSLTILPTFIVSLLHVSGTYIYKFFFQFLGAIPVILIYFLAKEYASESIAFLVGFLYISFPTFMVDMAFLNRQGIAFIFFSALVFGLFTTEYFNERFRTLTLFLFGTGMILSHYSTSYVAIPLLIAAYILNKLFSFAVTTKRPQWFARLANRLANKEIYERKTLLTLPLVIGLFCIMLLWSVGITKTSTSFFNTIQQVAANIQHPFSGDSSSVDAYSLVSAQQETPQQIFTAYLDQQLQQVEASTTLQSGRYSLASIKNSLPTLVSEPTVPMSKFGEEIQSLFHLNLGSVYNAIKQWYAKILQVLLFLGLFGLAVGYSFRKNLLHNVPREFIALSVAGIALLVGQTILPSSAVDYGLLRLFQQVLIFLSLPIVLGLIGLTALVTQNKTRQLLICTGVLLFFFLILSGLFPQWTGGGRAPLPLDNYGFYYDAYFTHAQEVDAMRWIAQNADTSVPIESDHYFSNIKMITYAGIAPISALYPADIERNAYVYLNYTNAQTGHVIDYIGGDLIYYEFPLNFLSSNKNLIYNDGGSEIYR